MRTHFLIRLSWVPLPDAVAKEAGIQITSTGEFEGRNTMQNHSKNENNTASYVDGTRGVSFSSVKLYATASLLRPLNKR